MASERGVAEPLVGAVVRAGRLLTMAAARATCKMWNELLIGPMACRLGSAITNTMYTDTDDPHLMMVYHTSHLAGRINASMQLARWTTRILTFARPRTRPTPRPQSRVQPDGAATLALYAGVLYPGFATALLRHVDASGPSLPAALRLAVRAGNVELVELLLPAMIDPIDSLWALDGVKDTRIVGIIGPRLAGALDDTHDDDETFKCLNDVLRSSACADDAVRDALAEHLTFPDGMLLGAFRWALDCGQTGLARWIHARNHQAVADVALTLSLMSSLASGGHLDTMQWVVRTIGMHDIGIDLVYRVLCKAACKDHLTVVQWMVDYFGLAIHRDHCAVLCVAIRAQSTSVVEWILQSFPIGWRALAANESIAMDTLIDLLDEESISWRMKITLIEALGVRAADVPA